jgi:hypothetical protein
MGTTPGDLLTPCSYQGFLQEGPDILLRTMRCCLEPIPDDRPDFEEIVSLLSKSHQSPSQSPSLSFSSHLERHLIDEPSINAL